jgi:N-acetylglucosamine transport system permease protein
MVINAAKKRRRIKPARAGFMCFALVPAFALFIVFNILPTLDVFRMSLYRWSGIGGDMKFVFFGNFKEMFANKVFWDSFGHTVFLMLAATALTMFSALVFAFILSKSRVRGKAFFRVVFYIPNILSVIVIAAIFANVFVGEGGLFNGILELAGLKNLAAVQWLSNKKTVLGCILFVMVWQAVGYYMIMYIAGMDGISESIYESASIDGATGAVKFFKITLPLTWEIIRVTVTLFITGSINLSFLLVKAMTNGGPDNASDVLLNTMYYEAYGNSNYGYGMAIGAFMFVFTFGLSLVISRLTSSESNVI